MSERLVAAAAAPAAVAATAAKESENERAGGGGSGGGGGVTVGRTCAVGGAGGGGSSRGSGPSGSPAAGSSGSGLFGKRCRRHCRSSTGRIRSAGRAIGGGGNGEVVRGAAVLGGRGGWKGVVVLKMMTVPTVICGERTAWRVVHRGSGPARLAAEVVTCFSDQVRYSHSSFAVEPDSKFGGYINQAPKAG